MGRMFAVLPLLAALTACEETMWVKPGATQAEFNQATYECERDTRMSAASFGYGFVAQVAAASFAQRCMNSKGFYQQSARTASNVGEPDPDYVRYKDELSAWYTKWDSCKARHRTAAARQTCVGPTPTYGAIAAPANGESYQSRYDSWFKRFAECDAQHGGINNGNTRLGCSGLPPSS